MGRVVLTPDAVRVAPGLLRPRDIYYEELTDAVADGRHLCLRLYDGEEVRVAVGEEARGLAERLHDIVGDAGPVVARVSSLGDLRLEVARWMGRIGFTAAPFVDFLLRTASRLGASDLHLAWQSDGAARLSLRLDGTRHDVGPVPAAQARRAIGRLKVLAGAQAHRVDLPQEGRVLVDEAWVRLSFVPSVGGEAVTARLFDRLKGEATLAQLGFDLTTRMAIDELLAAPHGVLLVAGPSGSGKTTTLYTMLRHLLATSATGLRAVTVEDPVEYRLDGVVQLEPEPQKGVTGAELLRAVLRQDADLLVVGEVRDAETTALILRAGLTGQRVLGTIHAGDATEALMRLLERGATPAVLGAALNGVVAQRLVRRRVGGDYSGRMAVGEVLRMDADLRTRLADPSSLRRGRGLANAAQALVTAGLTDAAEIRRVLGAS